MTDLQQFPSAADPLSAAVAERDRNILATVRAALRNNQALLAYQPVVAAQNPDRIAFWEGLVRVLDHDGRVIPAREFIDVVETDEIGRLIDCQSLRIGLEALRRNPSLRLALNMSARSIGYRPWREMLDRGLAQDPTIAERLILEITERSAMVMPDIVAAFLAEHQERGVSFALDDFGAGYTAFRYLREFYFDIVKIDGQFVRGIHADADNQVLTAALVSIAAQFDMMTVAEMVETAADARYLADNGVDCLQGYFFGVPTTKPAWDTASAPAAHGT